MASEVNNIRKKKNKKRKKSKLISFDEETFTKDVAEKILSEESVKQKDEVEGTGTARKKSSKKKKKKHEAEADDSTEANEDLVQDNSNKPKKKLVEEHDDSMDIDDEPPVKPANKKRKKLEVQAAEQPGENGDATESKKTESIRAQKRQKYAKLLEDKKIKTELALQEKALNYLSRWKHSRGEWKFEKLRQIWLQNNMYDEDKMPGEFWETLVQYFGQSKGKARDMILKDALKIIEEEKEEEENNSKTERARNIIQNLQE